MTDIDLRHQSEAARDFAGHADPLPDEPLHRLHWTDEVTGARGYLVVHTLVDGLATGGTRMRPGCTLSEVEDLAHAMALKTAAFALPVGGAKGGIDFDPKDPRADDVLARFYEEMRPWLENNWSTAEDLGVSQQRLDKVFARLGLGQSFHAAIQRSADPARTLERVQAGLDTLTSAGWPLGDVIGGYGVAQACLGVAHAWGREPSETTVAIQGIGTMGGGAAWYLHRAGMRVVAIADARGTLLDPAGLDVPRLMDLRDDYGEIDRSALGATVTEASREAVISAAADLLVPAAVSYAIDGDDVDDVVARAVVEAANSPTTAEAEAALVARGVPVIPDFVANVGSAAWAFWLLQGDVGTNPDDSFDRLRHEMKKRVVRMLEAWDSSGVTPRETGYEMARENARVLASTTLVVP